MTLRKVFSSNYINGELQYVDILKITLKPTKLLPQACTKNNKQ